MEIWNASNDTGAWHVMLDKLSPKLRDIYFYPKYVNLYRFDLEDQACLFVYRQANDLWLYPFLLHPVPQWNGFDIETAYGYGGPLASTDDNDFLAEAYAAFSYWTREQNVIAEFVRLHPILQNGRWLDPQTKQECAFETVSLSLTDPLPFDSKTRYMLRRAKRDGLTIRIGLTQNDWCQFIDLYLCAMDRLGADPPYYFSPNYFLDLYELIRAGNGWLLLAELDDNYIAAAVFLKGMTYLHYHLSASIDKPVPGAANLLIGAAAQMGKESGLAQLHLGGGRTSSPDDSLLKFKKSMATDSHVFYIGKRVHNQKIYEEVKACWAQAHPDLVDKYGNRLLCYRYIS